MKARQLRCLAAAMAAMHPDDRWEVSQSIPVHLLPEVARLGAECRRLFFPRRARPPMDQLFLMERDVTSMPAAPPEPPVSISKVSQTLDRLTPWMAAAAMRSLSGPDAEGVTPAARELLGNALLQLSQEPAPRVRASV